MPDPPAERGRIAWTYCASRAGASRDGHLPRPPPLASWPAGEDLVDAVEFTSKVLFYLWATVYRDRPAEVFCDEVRTYEALLERYEAGRHVFQPHVLADLGLGVEPAPAAGGEPQGPRPA